MSCRHAELLGELLERFSGPEPLKHILHPTSSRCEDGSAGRSGRIYDDLGLPVGGYSEEFDIAIRGIPEAAQVLLDHLREHTLAVTYHDQSSRRSGSFHIGVTLRIVVEQLGAIGIQFPESQSMTDASPLCNSLRAGRIRCIGTPLLRMAASTVASVSPTKGMERRLGPCASR